LCWANEAGNIYTVLLHIYRDVILLLLRRRGGISFYEPPCNAVAFVSNSEPRTGARPSVRVCVGLTT
jgi:hypothetical protein